MQPHPPTNTFTLMAFLFDSLRLKDVVLRNRIGVPPMCQYMGQDGLANDWHQTHYTTLARGGAGLVTVEATAVSPEGRITPACLGLWNDAQAEPLAAIAQSIRLAGAVPGIQIGHAGRKASGWRTFAWPLWLSSNPTVKRHSWRGHGRCVSSAPTRETPALRPGRPPWRARWPASPIG